jgi:hypothetical protein
VVAATAAAPHESVTYALTRRILLLFLLLLLLLLLHLLLLLPSSVGPGAAVLNEQARAIRDGTFDDAAAATAEAALS